MLIHIGCEIGFEVATPLVMTALLQVHPSRRAHLLRPERLVATPPMQCETFIDPFGNLANRLQVPAGRMTLRTDTLISDSGRPDVAVPDALQLPLDKLPHDVLRYLLASRYCEVDLMAPIAWELFGHVPEGWGRVEAVCDWVFRHVTFGYEFANNTRTAMQVYHERHGVCRDFQHLAVTFCRCLNIPARYVTGYLGDIGVPRDVNPMDYSAWFQCYLGGHWYDFDARHNAPRIGRVLVATGCDAVDCALTTTFGQALLTHFKVWTDEVSETEAEALFPQVERAGMGIAAAC